ncbi:MAG: VWA domain-containing protein [Rhodospirillales bacterium]|nr:VWA domain-containing protein [Rhodospirillales bacterium]
MARCSRTNWTSIFSSASPSCHDVVAEGVFAPFILALRSGGVPASITEYLALLAAMRAGVCEGRVEDFYYLGRAALVKDERHLDRYDRVFAACFQGVEAPPGEMARALPEEWLRNLAEKLLSPEEMAKIKALGGFDVLMETLRERLTEQEGRHQGGSKWIGTAGNSPFGAQGYNPEGVRIGQQESRHRRAVKVWDRREFRDLDDDVELGTRGMKLALRRLRRFARQGAASELDMAETIRATAGNAGQLDLKLVPERHNAVKVLLFLDIGGSMDEHVRLCEELFSAARAEFKHLHHFYFHNCPYERLWIQNRRRREFERSTWDILRSYGPDYRAVFVGDASMSPYEITQPGGSVEHWNEESGRVWMERLCGHFRHAAWLNPIPERGWSLSMSVGLVREAMRGRMYPLSLAGLDAMTRELSR